MLQHLYTRRRNCREFCCFQFCVTLRVVILCQEPDLLCGIFVAVADFDGFPIAQKSLTALVRQSEWLSFSLVTQEPHVRMPALSQAFQLVITPLRVPAPAQWVQALLSSLGAKTWACFALLWARTPFSSREGKGDPLSEVSRWERCKQSLRLSCQEVGYYPANLLATVKPTLSPAVSHVIHGRAWGAFIPGSQEACSLIMHKQDKKLRQCFPPTPHFLFTMPRCHIKSEHIQKLSRKRGKLPPAQVPDWKYFWKVVAVGRGREMGEKKKKIPEIMACF